MDLEEYRGKCGSCEHWKGSRDCTLKNVKKSSHQTCDEYQERLGIDFDLSKTYLNNRHVIIDPKFVNDELKNNIAKRVFKCSGGNGLYPFTMGSAVFGNWIFDSEYDRLERQFVQRFATDQEIKDATLIFTSNIDKEKVKTNPALKK